MLRGFFTSENCLPYVKTKFPDKKRISFLIELLEDIDPNVFRFSYDNLKASHLFAYINFVARFPD